jgi:hypothetical protein
MSLLLRKNCMETIVNKHITRKLDMAINRVDLSFIDFTEYLLLVVLLYCQHQHRSSRSSLKTASEIHSKTSSLKIGVFLIEFLLDFGFLRIQKCFENSHS